MARHRYPWSRPELRAMLATAETRADKDGAWIDASWRAALRDYRQAADLTAQLDTARREIARLCEEKAAAWPSAPDGEDTVTLPLVPAARDARAAEGLGDRLRDTDPDWCARHKTAVERTQEIQPEVQALAVEASGERTAEIPVVPLHDAPFAQPAPAVLVTTPPLPGPPIRVPHRDPANPAA